jgi:hypothetical protein
MAERSAIFKNNGGLTRIGYVEGNEAFDLSGRRRCMFNAASGNLCDLDSGKIIGRVSLEGIFVGASWIADESFWTACHSCWRSSNAVCKFVRRTQSCNDGRTRD